MIRVKGLHLQKGEFELRDIGFSIADGQYGVLRGATGSGKSSVLEAICGLSRPAAGRIEVIGRDVTDLRPAERNIGYVPQDGALFAHLSVRRHLSFALEIRRWEPKTQRERVDELANLLGVDRLLDRDTKHLSGGERQRVALGRALAFRPPVLLLDEPLSALDEDSREPIYRLLKEIQKREKVTVLHVTHSSEEARLLGDILLKIDRGRVVTLEKSVTTHADSTPAGSTPADSIPEAGGDSP